MLVCLNISFSVDDQDVGVGTVGDPELISVKNITIAVIIGTTRHRYHVGSGTRFRHCKSAHVMACDKLGQIFGFLIRST